MLRTAALRSLASVRGAMRRSFHASSALAHAHEESHEEWNNRYRNFFNKPDIDGWEIRKAINDLMGYDALLDADVLVASLRAIRRVNDYAVAVRWLEAYKLKCGGLGKEYWPYYLQEIRSTLDELGINTPEELGYDKPELAVVAPYE